MDATRGTAIVLVVIFHAIVEVDVRADLPEWTQVVEDVIAPARLPVVVFLSGLLLSRSLTKPAGRFLAGKVSRILWPFVLWSVLMLSLFVAVEPITGAGWSWADLLDSMVRPIDHLWFLRDLFLGYVLALATKRVNPILLAGAALAVTVASSFTELDELARSSYLAVFFMLGYWFACRPHALESVLQSRAMLTLSALAAVAVIPAAVELGDIRYQAALVPITGGMGLLIIRAMRRFDSADAFRPLRAVGRNSLSYYLIHWPVILILARGLPVSVFGGNPFVLLLLLVLFSFTAGWALSWLTTSVRPLRWITSFPPLEGSSRPEGTLRQ